MTVESGHAEPSSPIYGFNWGACILTWIWALGNKTMNATTALLTLASFIPYLGVVAAISLAVYSGRTGSRRARASKKWAAASEEGFLKSQRQWAKAGFMVLCFAMLLIMAAAIIGDR